VLLALTSHTPSDVTTPPPGTSSPRQDIPGTAPTTTTTSSSSSSSPLAAWLSNDRVLALLRHITKALRSGQLTELQLEQALLQQLEGQVRGGSTNSAGMQESGASLCLAHS
jgi:hypothetical protein